MAKRTTRRLLTTLALVIALTSLTSAASIDRSEETTTSSDEETEEFMDNHDSLMDWLGVFHKYVKTTTTTPAPITTSEDSSTASSQNQNPNGQGSSPTRQQPPFRQGQSFPSPNQPTQGPPRFGGQGQGRRPGPGFNPGNPFFAGGFNNFAGPNSNDITVQNQGANNNRNQASNEAAPGQTPASTPPGTQQFSGQSGQQQQQQPPNRQGQNINFGGPNSNGIPTQNQPGRQQFNGQRSPPPGPFAPTGPGFGALFNPMIAMVSLELFRTSCRLFKGVFSYP